SEAPEKLLRFVPRTLLTQQFQRTKGVGAAELFAQRLGETGHGFPIGDAVDVEPLEKLSDAISRLIPGGKLGLQLFRAQRFDVGQHESKVAQGSTKHQAPSIRETQNSNVSRE